VLVCAGGVLVSLITPGWVLSGLNGIVSGRGDRPWPSLVVIVEGEQNKLGATPVVALAEKRHPREEVQAEGRAGDPFVRRPRPLRATR
jgi:hypothetical protein